MTTVATLYAALIVVLWAGMLLIIGGVAWVKEYLRDRKDQ